MEADLGAIDSKQSQQFFVAFLSKRNPSQAEFMEKENVTRRQMQRGSVQKPCLMHCGSVQSSRILGIQFQHFHFSSHALFHCLGTWFSTCIRKGKIWDWWQWSCGLYGIEETNSELVPRSFLSCRWFLKPLKHLLIFFVPILSPQPILLSAQAHGSAGLLFLKVQSRSISMGQPFKI